jgi:hypothetical protein
LFTKKFKSDAIFHKLVNFILSPRLLRRCWTRGRESPA